MNNELGIAGAKQRAMALRVRTLVLTSVIIITLGFYLCVNAVLKDTVDVIDFAILTFVQIVSHCLYFPDGEIYGSRNPILVGNRKSYNEKATLVNQKMQFNSLKQYSQVDFDNRKLNYIETKLGYIGLTYDDYLYLKEHCSFNDLKQDHIEIEGKMIYLSKHKRKILKHVLFENIPIGYNNPETILSALDTDSSARITDKSRSFKIMAYVRKIFMALVVGGFMAYIGYTVKDRFSITDVVRMLMYLTNILTTAILSYSSGEVCQKQYKNEYYVELALFLDNFFEWLFVEKNININTITLEDIKKQKEIERENQLVLDNLKKI